MLYVFHVDTGSMMTFDINLALESVVQLKESIHYVCHIPVDKQVLLVSGGECLDPTARVCSYSAGTDTNPIFLFSKSSIESTTPPSPSIDYGSDADLKDQVDATLTMPATISTVGVRAQLAQQFCELAREQTRICEKLVHDQHLQQQGWSAVIANLDDITAAFRARGEIFEQSYKQYLDSREVCLQLLDSFTVDLDTLSKVPILPVLLEHDQPEAEENNEATSESSQKKCPETLLEWIALKDRSSSLEKISDHCIKGLGKFDEKILESLKIELNNCLDAANTSDLREIKGLEDRLYGLEQLMCETRKIVQEQGDLAQAFLQNQTRASNLGDASILPDLCASHRRQLQVMLKNHQQLRDIRRRCVLAKEELSVNLYHRLKWVMYVENRICEMDAKLLMHQENIKRLREHFQLIQQLHIAPRVYLSAVAEVVRRRTFSQAFLLWAGDLACQLGVIHSEEVARRKTFQEQFEGSSFLKDLFPGLEDTPPPFATQAPALFDSKLPKLSLEDIDRLRSELPDLALSLSVPDLSQITQFFLAKSITATLKTEPKDTAASIEDRLVEVVTAVGLGSNLDPALLQPADSQTSAGPSYNTQPTSDRGFESETDTEEFEKVGQSPTELAFDKQDRPPHQRPEEEVAALRECIQRLGGPIGTTIAALKLDINSLKEWLTLERSQLCAILNDLMTCYNRCLEERNEKIQVLNANIGKKGEELCRLHSVTMDLETRLKKSLEEEEKERQGRHDIEQSLRFAQEEQDRIVKEVTEQLTHAHKKEMEAVRSRFRLMACTSMERSPSDTSLEKIERSDLIELGNHEAIITQLKETLQLEKERAVNKEREYWEKILHQTRLKFEADKQISINEAMRRVVGEKERQIENMRLQVLTLEADCQKYKDTINRLTDNTGSGSESCSLYERVEALEIAKVQLEKELIEARKQTPRARQDMSTSVALVNADSGNRDAATSPDSVRRSHLKEKLTRSTTTLILQGKLSIGSCNIGDAVLVVWDESLGNYTILQDSTTLYFLHSDCIDTLQLRPSADGSLRRTYCIGEVLEKEYCHAKKPENRYHVPKGTKFYRVKVKPLHSLSRSQHSQSQSQSTSSVGSN
ncbi:autophagy-related 17 isoform X2 [Lycorma delicatula]|uniref:autophagy-related 17 isoform X2 n=1 Tax=Lycorma delicatula TaxID=130591 RepID=UPI003F51A4C3